MLVVLTTLCFGTFMGIVQSTLVAPSDADRQEVEQDHRKSVFEQDMAVKRRAISVYEEIVHPNEEEDHDEVHEGAIDTETGERIGWTGSSFYKWFSGYDERVLRPFFIRNYDRDVVILEDEYQEVLKFKFNEEQELVDIAERVDVIKRTQSVAAHMNATGRTQSRFMSVSADLY
jgi:hypothetical protein